MRITDPILSKSEVIDLAGITSTQFDNWRRRFLIPFSLLGRERQSLTTSKYSFLVAAYCRALSFHKGSKRNNYIQILKGVFRQFVELGGVNSKAVIAIADYGRGADCGLFESFLIADNRTKNTAKVPVGEIISEFTFKAEQIELV